MGYSKRWAALAAAAGLLCTATVPEGRGGERVVSRPGDPVRVVAREGRFVLHPGGRFATRKGKRRPAPEELVPGAQLSGRDLSDMDLSGRSLEGAVLVKANLSRADLRGVNLAGANLAGANLSGVKTNARTRWTGANLCMAETLGAGNFDPAGAKLHPFFEREAVPEGSAQIKEYGFTSFQGQAKQLQVGPKGDLFLLEGDGNRLWMLSPTGHLRSLDFPGRGYTASTLDSKGTLWLFRRGGVENLPGAGSAWGAEETPDGMQGVAFFRGGWSQGLDLPDLGPALAATSADQGGVWVSYPNRCLWLVKGAGHKAKYYAFALDRNLESLATSADGSCVFGADPRFETITMLNKTTFKVVHLPLAAGLRPKTLVRAADGRIWFTLVGKAGMGWISLTGGHLEVGVSSTVSGAPDSPDPQCVSLALHRDGRICAAEQTPPGIRFANAASLEMKRCSLPGNMVPEEIIASRDGTIFFTIKGRASVGRLDLGEAPETKEGSSSSVASSWERTPNHRKPRGPRLTGRERRERVLAQPIAPEEEPASPRGFDPAPGEEVVDFEEIKETKEGKEAKEAPGPSAPPDTPRPEREVLEDLGVYLSDSRIDHILYRHAYQADNSDGQFNPEFSTPETLPRLLLQGVRRAGEVGLVVKRYDPMGIRHTPCVLDTPIGYIHSPRSGRWRRTACMDIVTKEVFLEDGTQAQVVLSAYPVSEHAF